MRTLLIFFWKHYFFFLFLILEVFCFMMIYRNSYYQHSSMSTTARSVTGGMNKSYSGLVEYFHLKQTNELLANENAMLRSVLSIDSTQTFDSLRLIPSDTSMLYSAAQIVSNSVHYRNNYFTLDKGSQENIRPDMGVVSSTGVAGIIIGVSEHYSTAMSLLHKNSKISARIKKNNRMVSVSWGGIDYRKGLLEDIPTHIRLNPGDTIITSGHSHIFPKGIPIGTVLEFSTSDDQLFNTAVIEFTTDFTGLDYVYIIENLNLDEIRELNKTTIDE